METYGPVSRLKTLFGDQMLFVYDPKALQNIIVKEQYIYEETPIFLQFNKLFFGDGLLSSLGEKHRHQRKMLNPVFHTNHMRYMIPIFYRITHKLRTTLTKQLIQGTKEIDILSYMTRTALELVGQGGLGWSFDKLEDDTPNKFAEDLKDLVPTVAPLFIVVRLIPFLADIGTPEFRRRMMKTIPIKGLHKAHDIAYHLYDTAKEILKSKREALAKGDEAVLHQIGEGKDILSVLLNANTNASAEDQLPDEEILGHMSTFVFAAMDTTSGALSRILHMLSEHQTVQDKLRIELRAAQQHSGGDIPYDELVSLPYLEAICRETLRLHPPVVNLNRRTTQDVIMPLSTPIRGTNGQTLTEIPVPKGTDIMIGILAANRNKEIWGEDAYEWKPDRFLSPLPDAVMDAHIPGVYSNLMTFLGGGRACIGFKFSQLEMKVVLSVLISTFKFEMPEKAEVYWNFGGLQYPSDGKKSEKPAMKLKVSLAK